jgi:hypothetical protein
MRLAAGIIAFNDRKSLFRTLSTLTGCHYIFLVDGRFADFDYPTDLSDDGTRDLPELFENVVLIDCPATDEVTKRNRYLQACREYGIDYLIIIDSDEYVIDADWTRFFQNLAVLETTENVLGLSCCYDGTHFGPYPRLWKNPGQMEYYRCHNIFKNTTNGQIMRSPPASTVVEGIKLAWDVSLRTAEQERKTSEYQAKLIAKEKPIKRELFGG